jgi:hypothetical protein
MKKILILNPQFLLILGVTKNEQKFKIKLNINFKMQSNMCSQTLRELKPLLTGGRCVR